MNLRWGRYLRVSSEEQALPGAASIPRQDADTAALIAREGGVLVDTYQDDKAYYVGPRKVDPSGKNDDRPEWLRMLADIRSGRINAVCAWHSSRLYRDYLPAAAFMNVVEKHRVTVALCTESFELRWAPLQAWRDKEEGNTRVSRIMMGIDAKAAKGFNPTKHSKFYRTIRDEKGKRIGCELREEYRPFLDRMIELFLARMSYQRMAETLGRNPATGRQLTPTTLQNMLSTRWLLGVSSSGRFSKRADIELLTFKGMHPAAWDAETCRRVEAELQRRESIGRSVAHPRSAGVGQFSGVLRCGFCGHLMTARYTKYKGQNRYVDYFCHYGFQGHIHESNFISERKLLPLVIELAQAILSQPADEWARLLEPVRRAVVDRTALERTESTLAETRAELASLPQTAVRSRAALLIDLEEQEGDLARLQAQLAREQAPAIDPDEVRSRLAHFADNLAGLARDEIAAVLPAIYVKNKQISPPVAFVNSL